jgi:general secretion pathway protein G
MPSERVGMEKKSAFSLIEVMIVLVILGLLASLIIPTYRDRVDKTKYETSKLNLQAIAKAMEQYHMDHSRYPVFQGWQELAAEQSPLRRYINTIPLEDGWGRPYEVKVTEQSYELLARGVPDPELKQEYPDFKVTTDIRFSLVDQGP